MPTQIVAEKITNRLTKLASQSIAISRYDQMTLQLQALWQQVLNTGRVLSIREREIASPAILMLGGNKNK